MRVSSRRATLGSNLTFASLVVLPLLGASIGAYADDPNQVDQVTVYAPAVRVVGRDDATLAPIEQRTVSVRVHFDPPTLTTNSGRALLDDSVNAAARQACDSAGLVAAADDASCIDKAVASAQPQVQTAIAHAQTADAIQQRRLAALFSGA
jgi:UrcA family protein